MDREHGQTLTVVALMLPALVALLLALLDFATATLRVQATAAAMDLAVHAGVQEVEVLPDGSLRPTADAAAVVEAYFRRNLPSGVAARAVAATCGVTRHPRAGRVPYCRLQAEVEVGGAILPRRPISLTAVGYLPYGATREGQ